MKHILMVDDVTTNLKVAAEVLQPYYQLSMAKSGKQALQFLRKSQPDLILLDIRMPDMDGYETMAEIKLNPATANIPIIFLTADSERTSEIKGMQMGALDFITKPFDADAMLGRIEKVLQMEEMRKNLLVDTQKDVLTGLLNEDAFEKEVDVRLQNTENTGFLVLLDFDDLEKWNAYKGQETMDLFLSDFSVNVTENKHHTELFGRTKNHEFVLFVDGTHNAGEIQTVVSAFSNAMQNAAQKYDISGITFSAGVVSADARITNYKECYRRADKALYFAKQSGKNQVHVYAGR